MRDLAGSRIWTQLVKLVDELAEREVITTTYNKLFCVILKCRNQKLTNQCNDVIVRSSASWSVDLGFIPLVESYQKTSKMVSTAFLHGARHLGYVVENKPASLLVVSLDKELNGMPNLFVEDRWLKHLKDGNFQVSADVPSKRKRYNSLSG